MMFAPSFGTTISASDSLPLDPPEFALPPLERARLAALRRSGALDPLLQPALDRIASCAAVSLRAPLGAVSLVEADAVILAGAHGFALRRASRAGSLCAELVRLASPLLSGDIGADPRFNAHAFVRARRVRSYAGAPILAGDGEVLGAVCAFAEQAGAFGPEHRRDLEALAHMVELLLQRIPAPPARQGWIGVRTLDAKRSGPAATSGLVVLSVAAGSPAERAGLRPTDILHAIDDRLLRERADLVAALTGHEPGASARVTFRRTGAWMERWVQVAAPPTRTRTRREG